MKPNYQDENIQEPAEEAFDLVLLADLFNTAELTTIYNTILNREATKLSSKRDGIQALKEFFCKPQNGILGDHLGSLPKEMANVLKANGALPTKRVKHEPLKVKAPVTTEPVAKTEKITIVDQLDYRFNSKKGVTEWTCDLMRGDARVGETVTGPLDPDAVIAAVHHKFPESNSSYGDVACNKSLLRSRGYLVPVIRKVSTKPKAAPKAKKEPKA